MNKVIYILRLLIPYFLIQPITLFIAGFIYLLFYNEENLNRFLYSYGVIVTIIVLIIYLFTIIKKYKVKFNKVDYSLILPFTYLGLSLSLLLNSLILLVIKPDIVSNINIILSIISVGIIGPIIEEIIFRGILYNYLSKYMNNRCSLLLTTIIFSLLHFNLINIIFAFIMGLIFNIIYLKYKNINYSIITHVSCNIASLMLTTYDNYIILLSIIGIIISTIILIKKHNLT